MNLEQARRQPSSGRGPAIAGDEPMNGAIVRDCAASFGQRRLWFFEQIEPGTSVLHMSFVLKLTGPVDRAALERAFAELQRRHETLRTAFTERDGELRQIVSAPARPPFAACDLRHLTGGEREAALSRITAEHADRPFELRNGPLWRVCLIQLQDAEYRLAVCFHHLICDGASHAIFARELAALYRACCVNLPNRLPPLAWQYGDFAAWQMETDHDPGARSRLAHWVERLRDAPAALELPADRPRPNLQTFRGGTVSARLDKDLTWRMERLGRDNRATLFMVLLAGFSALLSRLSGQDDVVVGAPVAGRVHPNLEPMIGLFINTLPLRMDLGGDPTFLDLIDRARTTALDAFEHQTVPFEQIVAAVCPDRERSNTPLFQVLFNMQQAGSGSALSMGGVKAEVAAAGEDLASKFDLTVYLTRGADGVELSLVYNADLFDRARIEEMAAQYRLVLTQLADQPEMRLAAIDVRTPGAAATLPDPVAPLSAVAAGSMLSRFREHVAAAPTRTAIAWPGGTWTYEDLDRRSDAIASALRAGGVGANDVVSIYAHRSAPLVGAVVGVLKAGAAFSILDPLAPLQRLLSCVSLAKPAGFIAIARATPLPPELRQEIEAGCRFRLDVDEDFGRAGLESPFDIGGALDLDRIAYVAFTSGSTGGVKAVAGTQRPLSHFFEWYERTFGLTTADAFSVLSGLAHDPLLRDILAPLWVGGRIELPPEGHLNDADVVAAWMATRDVTVANLTPPMARLLADAAGRASARFSSLRHVFFAGDSLTTAVVDQTRTAAPNAGIVNFYGATETPQAMAFWRVPQSATAIPLGSGIDGVQLLIVNPGGRLAGVGEPGEICIRTPYLSLGYLGDSELTRERFVVNPFTGDAADRVYRSGDLGRYRPDGTVEFAGRADSQVKIRGFRVELQEVEHALRRHASVADAVALAREDARGDRSVVAYWVPRPGEAANAVDLRASLRDTLADYAMPAHFVEVPALPLTPNGKVDRRALAAMSLEPEPASHEFVAPRSASEQRLAAIWSEVLGVPRIGIHDNFFDLGGHSLLAMQLVSRLHDRHGIDVPLRRIFEASTIEQLSRTIDDGGGITR